MGRGRSGVTLLDKVGFLTLYSPAIWQPYVWLSTCGSLITLWRNKALQRVAPSLQQRAQRSHGWLVWPSFYWR